MSEVKIQVRYRDPTTDPPDEFLWATLDDTNPAVLVVIEKLNSYGQKRVTRIPWDRIANVVTVPA